MLSENKRGHEEDEGEGEDEDGRATGLLAAAAPLSNPCDSSSGSTGIIARPDPKANKCAERIESTEGDQRRDADGIGADEGARATDLIAKTHARMERDREPIVTSIDLISSRCQSHALTQTDA